MHLHDARKTKPPLASLRLSSYKKRAPGASTGNGSIPGWLGAFRAPLLHGCQVEVIISTPYQCFVTDTGSLLHGLCGHKQGEYQHNDSG